jgi:hypothetical protein
MNQAKNILLILIVACIFFTGCTGNEGNTTTTQKTTATTVKTSDTNTSPDPYEMGLVRSLPAEADAGTTFTVTLTLTFNGTRKPGLLGVTEDYPSNWTATNISDGGIHREKRSAIEWLFFPPLFGQQAQNTTLSYQLTAPKDVRGTYFFDSEVLIGSNQETTISGQDNITIN